MEIITNDTKTIQLNKTINIDGSQVKQLSANIDSNGQQVSFSEYTYRMDLYKANRAAIRKIEVEFEDEAFAEQDRLTEEKVTDTAE